MGVERGAEGLALVAGLDAFEGALHGDVARRVGEVLLGAEDVRDAHELIVDDDGEVVGGEVVGLADDEVVHLTGGNLDVAENLVVDDDGVGIHGEADDMTPPLPACLGALPARLVEDAELDVGGAGVFESLLAGDVLLAQRIDLFVGLEGGVGVAALDEGFDVGVVDAGGGALGLEVGADIA